MPVTNPINRLIGKIEKPGSFDEYHSANRTTHALKKDDIAVSHVVIGRAADTTEARLCRLAAIEDSRKERLGKYREMKAYVMARRQVRLPEVLALQSSHDIIAINLKFVLQRVPRLPPIVHEFEQQVGEA